MPPGFLVCHGVKLDQKSSTVALSKAARRNRRIALKRLIQLPAPPHRQIGFIAEAQR
jgi:hypothetical protein